MLKDVEGFPMLCLTQKISEDLSACLFPSFSNIFCPLLGGFLPAQVEASKGPSLLALEPQKHQRLRAQKPDASVP